MQGMRMVFIAFAIALAGHAEARREKVDFTKAPGRFVGRLLIERDGFKAVCTATLVAYDIILTAAHCLAKSDGIFDGRVTPDGATFQLQYSEGAYVASSTLETAVTSKEYEKLATPIHGGDWALARLRHPLGRKFGYLELANVILPVGHAIQALGYSKGGNEEHPGIDPDCKVGAWDTETSRKFRAAGIPTGNYFMSSCDIDAGASGGPTVANVDYTDGRGVKSTVMRLFAVNAALDRKAVGSEKTISTAIAPIFQVWGSLALYGHMDELHRVYKGSYPATLRAHWKTTLERWDRLAVKDRRKMLYDGLADPKTIPEALIHGRELEARERAAFTVRYATGLVFDGPYAPLTVIRVEPGSAAEDAGVRVGDRIVLSELEKYPNEREFKEGVDASGGHVLLTVARNGAERRLSLRWKK